jgi:(R,R)-butanediol dehydrogenase/meso-butanediol dehydrogenase/diacetyl reductase
MRAVRFHGNQDLRLDDVSIAEVGPDQVKVAPEWCGICGTDLHEYLDGPQASPATPHPITKEGLPRVFGHEFAGILLSF